MTRYSDIIAHLQEQIQKYGDQAVTPSGKDYGTFYLFYLARLQCIALNKAIHRKNRHIDRLKGEIQKMQDKLDLHSACFMAGQCAFNRRELLANNPYSREREADKFQDWRSGWWHACNAKTEANPL